MNPFRSIPLIFIAVHINVHSLSNQESGAQLIRDLRELERQAADLEKEIQGIVRVRGGFEIE